MKRFLVTLVFSALGLLSVMPATAAFTTHSTVSVMDSEGTWPWDPQVAED